jgi:hypothetical protein
VITLPHHLTPWAPHLALFPEDIALALGPLVVKLSQLIGAARMDHGREGTPDGYDGIDRRGPYERLLASEWLIHDEIPDEFLRRVVSGEHSFLRRLYRHEAEGRRSIALFDSGIDQLGAPRIAHLAALIVLAQRADRVRANFAWGILQEPDGALHASVTEDAVRTLVDSRCTGRVSDGDIARWMAVDGVAGASEIWLVGPERLTQENAVQQPGRHQASVLAVSDVLAPETPPRIKVTVSGSQGRRPRTVTLDVPEQRAAAQLLRDPFGKAVAARHKVLARLDVRSAMVFSADGRRLYLHTADGGLLIVQVPNSPRATVGGPTEAAHLGAPVLAVGAFLLNKRSVVVCRQGDQAVVHLLHKRGMTVGLSARFGGMPAGTDDGVLRPLGILAAGRHMCFLDADGHLVLIDGDRLTAHPRKAVLASRATRDAFVYVEGSVLASVKVMRAGKDGELSTTTAAVDLPDFGSSNDIRYYFGVGGLANLVVYSPAESRCTIIHQLETVTFHVPSGHTVIGLVNARTVEHGRIIDTPFAVAIDDSRTGIMLLRPGASRRLLTTTAPITSAAVSDAAPVIAFITQSGELGVYSCSADATVLHLAPETVA